MIVINYGFGLAHDGFAMHNYIYNDISDLQDGPPKIAKLRNKWRNCGLW